MSFSIIAPKVWITHLKAKCYEAIYCLSPVIFNSNLFFSGVTGKYVGHQRNGLCGTKVWQHCLYWGQFTQVGLNIPYGAAISTGTGNPGLSYAKPNNAVRAAAHRAGAY
jgi:hypothetical protein